MNLPKKAVLSVAPLLAACALAFPAASRADLRVNETVKPIGNLFQYNYTVANFTPTDLLLLDINNLPTGPNAVQNLMEPAGFQGTYDSGLNIVSFLAAPNSPSVFPAGSILSGFSFQSPFAPVGTTFSAFDANGNTVGGTAVPEPGTALPLISGIFAAGLAFRRRARRNR